jgi:Ca2+/Na+ antiporter
MHEGLLNVTCARVSNTLPKFLSRYSGIGQSSASMSIGILLAVIMMALAIGYGLFCIKMGE